MGLGSKICKMIFQSQVPHIYKDKTSLCFQSTKAYTHFHQGTKVTLICLRWNFPLNEVIFVFR